jgi:6-phosphofructo-2-kinase
MPHNVLDNPPPERTATLANHPRKQSQHSIYAKSVLMSTIQQAATNAKQLALGNQVEPPNRNHQVLPPDALVPKLYTTLDGTDQRAAPKAELKPRPRFELEGISKDGVGIALSDTPAPSLPSSPRM